MALFRSLLFAPCTRPDRFERAIASGADAVCLDLEDAVPPDMKTEARAAAVAFLSRARPGGPAVGVRINPVGDVHWRLDVEAAMGADFLVVPKVASVEQLALAAGASGLPLWPLIETPIGVMRALEVAANSAVEGVIFGAFDFATEAGCELSWEPLLFARSTLVTACAHARKQLLDAPYGDVLDLVGLVEFTRRAKALGFTGRSCIHPNQVELVHSVFTPSAEEVAAAERILDAFVNAKGAAAQLDGKLIELPVANAARRVIERARRSSGS